MAFVRAKKAPTYQSRARAEPRRWDRRYGPKGARGHRADVYYQLVESYRDGGKIRQRVLLHMGQFPTVDEYVGFWTKNRAVNLKGAEDWKRTRPGLLGRYIRPDSQMAVRCAVKAQQAADRLQYVEKLRAAGRIPTHSVLPVAYVEQKARRQQALRDLEARRQRQPGA